MAVRIEINKMPLWTRLRLGRGAKKRNKRLLARLSLWYRENKAPLDINRELGTGPDELAFLLLLTWAPGPWADFEFTPRRLNADLALTAGLGLVDLRYQSKKIALTDAGRFLLLLSSADENLLPEELLKPPAAEA